MKIVHIKIHPPDHRRGHAGTITKNWLSAKASTIAGMM